MFWKLILLICLTSFGACNPFGNGTKVNLPTSNTGSGSSTGGGGDYTSFGTGADGDVTLTADLYNTFAIPGQTKKWGKTARVTSISGNDINLAGAPPNDNDFAVGDEIMWHITTANASCSTDASLYLGAYGFANITAKAGTTLTLDQSVTANPNNANISNGTSFTPAMGNYCNIQIVRVANFNNLTVTTNVYLKNNNFSMATGLGGLVAFRVKGTLTVASGNTFTVSDRFTADGTRISSGLQPHNGSGDANIQAPAADGMGIATCNTSLCGTEANNGAGGGRGLSDGGQHGGGGGGANLGNGGRGGSVGAGADYGHGGIALNCASSQCMFMGSASGSGSTGAANNGISGGGVFIAFIRNINGNFTMSANGIAPANGTVSGGGGSSAGSARLQVENVLSGAVQVTANGGAGANSSINYGGGGGGGGLAYVEVCTGTITATASGGAGGTNAGAGDASLAGSAGVATVNQATTHNFCPQ